MGLLLLRLAEHTSSTALSRIHDARIVAVCDHVLEPNAYSWTSDGTTAGVIGWRRGIHQPIDVPNGEYR